MSRETEDRAAPPEGDGSDGDQVMVVGPDGRPVGTVRVTGGVVEESDEARPVDAGTDADAGDDPAEMVEQPAKVMRIGTMIKQLLEEVRGTELDDASRRRVREVHASSLQELAAALSPDLRAELDRLMEPFSDDPAASTPSDGELRIAQAQLVGWLEGLFHGIQTTLVAQQMAAKMQLEQMRRGLPSGSTAASGGGGTTGQYL